MNALPPGELTDRVLRDFINNLAEKNRELERRLNELEKKK